MASVLSGHLAYVSPADILKILTAGQQSGRLMLQKDENRESAEVYLQNGKITHCVCGNYLGEPAFKEMILWTSGKFAFDAGMTSSQITIDKDTKEMLAEGSSLSEVWRRVNSLIPSFSTKAKLTGHEPAHHIKLKGPDWEVIHILEKGERTISEMAQQLKMKDIEVASIVFTLVQEDVVQMGEVEKPAPKEAVSKTFFDNLENELIQLMGPVASIIIDDVIEAYGESRSGFPKEKVASLVESISNEIYDPQKQVAFQQLMLRQIRSL